MYKKIEINRKNIFIGVAWPYVNGDIHIGHMAGYLLPADIIARYYRADNYKVLMVSGSDCFGTPITIEADKRDLPPQTIADIYHKQDERLFKEVLGLTYDIYTRTDTENHIKTVQDVFMGLLDRGYIFIDTTKQFYSPQEKKFLPDRYVEGECKNCGYDGARADQCENCGKLLEQDELINPKSKLTEQEVILKDTEHYFLDWSLLQPQINDYVAGSGSHWKNWVFQETQGWLRKGLKPRAITRDINWGVPLPTDRIPSDKLIDNHQEKRLYVWFDAVIGYLSASKLWAQENSENWENFWYNQDSKHYYFMGKDNLIFHTILWPGQLIGYDPKLHLPDMPSVNMFYNLEGQKFSKSKNITIGIEELVNQFGNDAVRFYTTLTMPETKDASFKFDDFIEKNNQLLVGNLGNYIHRILSIASTEDIGKIAAYPLSSEVSKAIDTSFEKARSHIQNCEFRNYLDDLLNLSDFGNKFFSYQEVWKLKKTDREQYCSALKQLYSMILALGYLMVPVLPETSTRLAQMLEIETFDKWPQVNEEINRIEDQLKQVKQPIKPTPLFRKIDPKETLK